MRENGGQKINKNKLVSTQFTIFCINLLCCFFSKDEKRNMDMIKGNIFLAVFVSSSEISKEAGFG